MDAATTSSTGSYSDSYTYPATGTYTINATFQGSPTTLPSTSPGAGGIPGDYLLPCGPLPPPRMSHTLLGGLLHVHLQHMQPLLQHMHAQDGGTTLLGLSDHSSARRVWVSLPHLLCP